MAADGRAHQSHGGQHGDVAGPAGRPCGTGPHPAGAIGRAVPAVSPAGRRLGAVVGRPGLGGRHRLPDRAPSSLRPAPGARRRADAAGLRRRADQRPLDRRRPLWEFHLIDGYQGGGALLVRIHHCIGDGIALGRVLLSLTDHDAGADP